MPIHSDRLELSAPRADLKFFRRLKKMDSNPSGKHFPDENSQKGTLIDGRYEIQLPLGTGGMGDVYLVFDKALNNEPTALKLLHKNISNELRHVRRFRNEVIVARKLSHPNIVRIYDFGKTDNGRCYITMEYIDGKSLYEMIPEEPDKFMELGDVVSILIDVARALSFAHSKNVIHRDLKPDNVLISREGEVKLTDFGIARSLDDDMRLTATGEMVGTAYYMSPEQLRGGEIDHRSDIYALGIVAYEMITGERPFNHENYVAISALHFTEPLPRASDLNPAVPGWFQDFMETCAEKEPADRFQSMDEVIEYLEDYLPSVKKNKHSAGKSGRRAKTSFTRTLLGFFGGD
ncbi:MAG: serine/threonine protein kinase [Candidatus Dadabacteria bacterium]|nr:MAG: serine/threonine protein kinase [Candidatus Dadabacteria bacterium]